MRLYGKKDIKISRWSAARSRFALGCQTDTGSIFNSRRNIDRKRALLRNTALTVTFFARILDDLSPTITGWAGTLHREKALRGADTANTTTSGTGCRL